MGALREIWSGRKHYLDKMSLGDLAVAYFRYPAIQAYLVLAGVAAYVASRSVVTSWNEQGLPLGLAVLAGFLVYPPSLVSAASVHVTRAFPVPRCVHGFAVEAHPL